MLDVRYHIFYLGLMFLMLGFGIFVGASVIGPTLGKKQTDSLTTLRQEVNKVVQDRNQARDRLAKDEAAINALRPALVRGKLAGKRVIVIQTGNYSEAADSVDAALADAGATVVATVSLTDKWGTLTARQRETLRGIADPADPAAQHQALLTALAAVLTSGTEGSAAQTEVLPAMQRQGLVTVSGDLTQSCSLFVLVGGYRDDASPDVVEAPLLDGLKAASGTATVVGCEPFGAAVSSIPTYQSAGIATVDCVDLPLGQLALPFALHGDAGDYGLKPTARQQLPAMLGGASSP